MALPVSIQIKQMLINRIQNLESVQKCFGAMVINSDGFPAVYVTPQSMSGNFSSNAEDSREFTYDCVILMPVSSDWVDGNTEMERMEFAERVVAQVGEEIEDAIDKDFTLDNGVMLFAQATDAQYGYVEAEFGWARTLTVTVQIYTELTVIT